MKFYDILFLLNSEERMVQVEWGNSQSEEMYHLLFNNWITRKVKFSSAFQLSDNETSGELIWDEEHFYYEKRPAPDQNFYLFMKKRNDKEYLFERALDHISDGIQIYDKNAAAVYFNKSSRSISQIPDEVSVEGRHLLDMYDLEDRKSVV